MSDRIYKALGRIPMWQWLLASVITSELLTLLISLIASHVLWGEMPNEVLIIGVIDSLFVSFVIVGVLLLSVRKIRELHDELEQQNEELTRAFSEIKTLQGILPICSYCKQIRNDSGYYEQIEAYLHKHSGVDFSHTICPTCLEEHYPEEYETIVAERGRKGHAPLSEDPSYKT